MTLEKLDWTEEDNIQLIADKVNEIIEYINGVEAAFGIEIGTEVKTGTECCKDDGN